MAVRVPAGLIRSLLRITLKSTCARAQKNASLRTMINQKTGERLATHAAWHVYGYGKIPSSAYEFATDSIAVR